MICYFFLNYNLMYICYFFVEIFHQGVICIKDQSYVLYIQVCFHSRLNVAAMHSGVLICL